MIDFSSEIALIKDALQKNLNPAVLKDSELVLKIIVSTKLNSEVDSHRLLIRQNIIENFESCVSDQNEFRDLDKIPHLKTNYVSISHSVTQGGYAFSDQRVGFDLIERDRLNEKIVQRVTTGSEQSESPDLFFLWPAKEAVFKACSDQFAVITEFRIDLWKKLGENVFSFSVLGLKGQGFVFEKSSVLYGLFFSEAPRA